MRIAIGLATALLWATPTLAQTPPDTFKAGIGEQVALFYVNDNAENAQVAFRLPTELEGNMIRGIRAFYRQAGDPSVTPEVWAQSAGFAWGLSTGSESQPATPTGLVVPVPLKDYPSLQFGGWLESALEWPVPQGVTHWVVGYWPQSSPFTRLASNHRNSATDVCVGLLESGSNAWYPWTGGGLMVEVTYGPAGEDTPSGIFDEPARDDNRGSSVVRASVAGSELTVTVPSDLSPIRLQVVNILGQTVVSHTGMADFGVLRVPWSASHPSGVYFCRIQSGAETYAVPFVSVK